MGALSKISCRLVSEAQEAAVASKMFSRYCTISTTVQQKGFFSGNLTVRGRDKQDWACFSQMCMGKLHRDVLGLVISEIWLHQRYLSFETKHGIRD